MAKIICSICGKQEETEDWEPGTAREIEDRKLCHRCLHWAEQKELDEKVRGAHGWAVIDGTHYVLGKDSGLPNSFGKGMCGANHRIRFRDGFETACDNLWCQGDIPEGHWREVFPDNAEFV